MEVDTANSSKANQERLMKQLEIQYGELQNKFDDQSRHLQDSNSLKTRLQSENSELSRQLEDAESQVCCVFVMFYHFEFLDNGVESCKKPTE